MRNGLKVVVCLASVAIGPAAFAGGWHVGATAGISMNDDFVSNNDDGSLSMLMDDDNDTSWSVFGGFGFNDYVAVEAGYTDHGETEFTAVSDGSGNSWVAGDVATNFEANAFFAQVVGRLPVGERWTLFASLGLASWDTTETFTENGVVTEVDDNSGTDVTYGVGFEWDLGKKDDWALRGEYTTGDVDDDGDNIQSARVGAVFRF